MSIHDAKNNPPHQILHNQSHYLRIDLIDQFLRDQTSKEVQNLDVNHWRKIVQYQLQGYPTSNEVVGIKRSHGQIGMPGSGAVATTFDI